MARRNKRDRWVTEDAAMQQLSGVLTNIDRAESWLGARIEATHSRALSAMSGRKGIRPTTYQSAIDGRLPLSRVSSGQVLTGREVDLSGDRRPVDLSQLLGDTRGLCLPQAYRGSDGLRTVRVRANLVGSTIEARDYATGLGLQVELDRLARLQATDDTKAARIVCGHESGLVVGAPQAHAGMTGKSSACAAYPPCSPGDAAGVSRRPLANPSPTRLLSSGWTLAVGDGAGLAVSLAVSGGRGVSPTMQAVVYRSKATRRGKKGGKRHKSTK